MYAHGTAIAFQHRNHSWPQKMPLRDGLQQATQKAQKLGILQESTGFCIIIHDCT